MSNRNPPNPTCCIVGFGIAGQLLLLELLQRGVNPQKILILDESFRGGDLATQYSSVISNTPWQKTRQALETYMPWSDQVIRDVDQQRQLHECHPVAEIARACFLTAKEAQEEKKVPILLAKVNSAHHKSGIGWILETTQGKIQTPLLFLAQGSLPKTLPLDLPMLPLEIALDREKLQKWVEPHDHIVVFGTAHSGVILLKHLHDLGISTTAIYDGDKPFRFARENQYDGLKEGSALLADSILRGEYTNLSFLSLSDTEQVNRILQKATWVIPAIGFQPRPIPGIPLTYSPQTAVIGEENRNCYGFGIAYPGTTVIQGKVYADVSVSSFQDQIQRILPAVLDQNKDFLE